MKRYLLVLAALTVVLINSYSQIGFEKGYFVDETGQRVECLIKNIDWKNNPAKFEYRLFENDAVQQADIQGVKEFGINGGSKYIRATVKIDRSSEDMDKLSSERNPVFKEELLFLKIVTEGKATLFQYTDGFITRFFFQAGDAEISQLVYKKYYITYSQILSDDKSKVKPLNLRYNNDFRQQLFTSLTCQDITLKSVEYINYNRRDLERLFVKYNVCIDPGYVNLQAKQKKGRFNMTIRPGLNSCSLAIDNSVSNTLDTDFGTGFSFRFGVETELILPFNKNKWGILAEPAYHYYKSETTKETSGISGGTYTARVNYQSLELPLGIRYYFFINDKSKIFLNASYILNFSPNSSIDFIRSDGSLAESLQIKPNLCPTFGLGYKIKDRYSIEMRYKPGSQILGTYAHWISDYRTLSLLLGYTLF